jgi:hypothetical protein
MKKYVSSVNTIPVDNVTIKENEEDHHTSLMIIHTNPTKSNIFFLYLKYLDIIKRPIIIAMLIKTRLNIPLTNSICVRAILITFQ